MYFANMTFIFTAMIYHPLKWMCSDITKYKLKAWKRFHAMHNYACGRGNSASMCLLQYVLCTWNGLLSRRLQLRLSKWSGWGWLRLQVTWKEKENDVIGNWKFKLLNAEKTRFVSIFETQSKNHTMAHYGRVFDFTGWNWTPNEYCFSLGVMV